MSFPFTEQYDLMDCGPACIKMVSEHYGKKYSLEYLRELCYLNHTGVSMLSLNKACENLGFLTYAVKTDVNQLKDCPLPCILHWNQEHFVVLYQVDKKRNFFSKRIIDDIKFKIADPAHGLVTLDKVTFLKGWITTNDEKGTVLLLEPTPDFYNKEIVGKAKSPRRKGYKFLFSYLRPHKKYLIQLTIGMLAASVISLSFPFLMQLLVDYGIGDKNMEIIYLILLSQLFLFLGNSAIEMLQSWLLLHVNTRVSLNIISDFLIKLLRLPIKFFDTKSIGDISQRIEDHHRIETFLTSSTLTSLFSLINIFVFTVVLAYYDFKILLLFVLFSTAAVAWIFLFQKKRKQLDYKRFFRNREAQDKLYEMITGMQEIKLYGSETPKRWEWERLQVKLFKLSIKSLGLEQYQKGGFLFLSQLKNIFISFIAAKAVVDGYLTLGVLLSISYIIGQTNGPLQQLVSFVKEGQDARISMDRMQEIHLKNNEEEPSSIISNQNNRQIDNFPKSITVDEVSFQYEGPHSPFVLKNINLQIPQGKVTAVVGITGSGKTTLMKLLLNFYRPILGNVFVGNQNLSDVSPNFWRSQCGTVMQDSYIFSDTIANNIALGGKPIDPERMEYAVKIANTKDFIESLPLAYTTKIGNNGIGISGGQRQRILIARAVYKNPQYLFFDEATSALDANNESKIMKNLNKFFDGRTVLIIAHRLSTVKNADQIIVLENGEIVERGTHHELTQAHDRYYVVKCNIKGKVNNTSQIIVCLGNI